MQENEQNIDDLLRDALVNYEERPGPEAWQAVQGRLAAAKDKNRHKPFPLRWWWVMGSMLLLVAIGIIVAGKFGINNNPVHPGVDIMQDINHAENGEAKRNLPEANKPTVQMQIIENEIADNTTKDNSIKTNHSEPAYNERVTSDNQTQKKTSETKEKIQNSNRKAQSTEIIDNVQGENDKTNSSSPNSAVIANKPPAARASVPLIPQLKVSGRKTNNIDVIAGNTPQKQQVSLPALLQLNIPDDERNKPADKPVEKKSILPSSVTKSETEQPLKAGTDIQKSLQEATKTAPEAKEEKGSAATSEQVDKPVGISTETNTKQDVQPVKDPELKDFSKGFVNRLAFGVKAGYQSSFNSQNNAGKWLLAGFLQYNVSGKLSIMLQPAYLSGKAKVTINGTDKVYYNIASSSLDTLQSIGRANTIRDPDTIYTSYVHTEIYDSIRISTALNDKKLWDVEVPLIVKYTILPGISITAGGVGSYSKAILITETRKDYKGLQNSYTENYEQLHEFNQPVPVPPQPESTQNLFNYTGEAISNYKPAVNSNVKNFFRWGYTVGVSAEVKKRLLLDISMLHMPTPNPAVTDVNIRKIYTQPSFRFTIGYQLKK